ncbi:hypothetical protein [Sphingomonas sp. Leaf38]|uniref:hypothetical protein n=1 Tax=Sphingomonas sp. Leaf38 TaxID=1736217 RepID=UPI0012E2AFA0|nr:hypothetical protein [Sphingomonas sp. Leaf38]
MSEPAIAFLKDKLTASECYLEYGSGGSSRLAARLKVPYIFSVESDVVYGKAVRRFVSRDLGKSKFKMYCPDIGPTGDWGYPTGHDFAANWPTYYSTVWDMIDKAEVSPDIILVDGRFRVACFLYSILRANSGTFIIFDDYIGREKRYSVVERYIKPDSIKGTSAIFVVPDNLDLRSVALDLVRYSMIAL